MAASRTAVGVACGVTTGLVWGGMFTITKSAYGHVDPYHLAAARFVIAAAVFAVILWVREGRTAFRLEGRALRLWGLATVGFAGFNLCTYVGLQSIPAQSSALVMATMPLVTVLVMWGRTRKAPPAVTLLLVLCALLGVALVLGDGNPARVVTGGVGFGGLLTLFGVAGWVFYTTGAAGFASWSPLRYTTLSCLLGTASIVVITAVCDVTGAIGRPSPSDYVAVWPQLGYVVFAATTVATLTWNMAFRSLGPSNGVLFINLVPVTAFAVQAVRGHRPTAWEITGVCVVLASLAASNAYSRGRARRAARAAAPAPARRTMAGHR
ncbi:DMT family transporter [Streptomyces rubradiris]|uniref:Transporter n=1 Tax=Streptomyces rubradiris TaxID=285531 RepID=A0ABQ3REX7_STRRR|nr:DMT family transporter [Streptomyces rubradiris]GHG97601.1 transporter [Streptomyces rubradiris]GHI54424.1 transporter [Streptomyces rubradiris]